MSTTKGIKKGSRKTRQVHEDNTREESTISEEKCQKPKSTLSVTDSAIIILLSTFLSLGLVVGTLGINGIAEKLSQNDMLDVVLTVLLFIGLFSVLSYLLVKFAAHYLVYLAIGTFCAIIFPVSRRRQRRALKEIYDKAETREAKQSD